MTVAAWALAGGLLLTSRWPEKVGHSPTQLTIGRVALLLALAALIFGMLAQRASAWTRLWRALFALPRTAALMTIALCGEGAIIFLSIATRGQNSAGAFYGYLELAGIAVIALILVRARSRLAPVLLMCAAGGALIGCLHALVTDDTTSLLHGVSGRLTGYYGNPNFLGFAGSLAVPVFLAFALRTRGMRAAACWLAFAITIVAIALSYSRGAALAATAGVIAVASLRQAETSRRLRVAAGSCAIFAALAAAGYPLYLHLRTHADFAPVANAGTPDRSGWDPRVQGLIPTGPSQLVNPRYGELRILARGAGEGASLPLGQLLARRRYRLVLTLASPTVGLEVGFGLEDNLSGNDPAIGMALLRPQPHSSHLGWTPSQDSPHARLYIWLPSGGSATVRTLYFGLAGKRASALPLQLLGLNNQNPAQAASESRYVHSREDAASLAFRLFRAHLLTGVGWQQFTTYSATDLHYGPLATHDEYLRYAAELGLPGLAFLLLMIAALARAVTRPHDRAVDVAAASCAFAAAVGLVFVNALEVPAIAAPLAVSAAVLCAYSPSTAD